MKQIFVTGISTDVGKTIASAIITEALEAQGYTIDKRKIILEEPIKSLGIYSVPIKLHTDVEAKVKVWVVKE